MRMKRRFPFLCLEQQTASTPLRTALSTRLRRMEMKKGGAQSSFQHCHWTQTPLNPAAFTRQRNWTFYKTGAKMRKEGHYRMNK